MVNKSITTPIIDAINILRPSIVKHSIKLITNFKTTRNLNIFSNELTQVILIILQNSVDNFIEKNKDNAVITITTQETKNNLSSIIIEDNGGGIDANIIEKVFDPYFSTKMEKNGTGLGLYMAKLIIEKYHKGELKVVNTKDGVSFFINFY